MKYIKVFASGILSGLFIAMGGLGFILCKYYLTGAGQIVGACVFPFGLYTICVFSLHLFTGKVGLVFEEKDKIKERAIDLPIMLIGNLLGAMAFGYISLLIFHKNEEVMQVITSISDSKSAANPWMTLLKSVLCGMCVFLAVYFYRTGKEGFVKFMGVFIPIFFFVLFGFEHCIANTFYFSFANGWNSGAFLNILLGIIGNSLGAWILWGLFYIAYYEKKEKDKPEKTDTYIS